MDNIIQFRCRLKSGIIEFYLPGDSSYQTLQAAISTLSGLPCDGFKILAGFPPKPIFSENPETPLSDLGITSNISLNVQQVQTPKQLLAVQEQIAKQFQGQNGYFIRHIVNADNSCLFSSINFLINGIDSPTNDDNQFLRQIVSTNVLNNPSRYDETFLEENPGDYSIWISNSNSWGGAIELDVFAVHFHVQINVVDTTAVKIHKFGAEMSYEEMIFIVYNGSHYDPLIFEFADPSLATRRKFSVLTDSRLFDDALELASELSKMKSQFICTQCNAVVYGEVEAANHSQKTGHINFTN